MRRILMALMIAATVTSAPVKAAGARRESFGTLADGTPVEAVVLTGGKGVSVRIMTLGATIQSVKTPDRLGRPDEITLGYDSAAEYLLNPQYFGVTVGRFANRIAGGRFKLGGESYTLATNDGPNHLHGGVRGFDKRLWSIVSVSSGARAGVVLRYVSADGEEGYPGELTVTVSYTLDDQGELAISYAATTSRPTIVNLTNHSYFNLAGLASGRSVLDQRLTIPASRFTPVDATLIPTGALADVADTPFDFRMPHAIGSRIHSSDAQLRFGRGYDHNWVLDDARLGLKLAARLEDPISGRLLEVQTSAPAVQFYSGNFLNATVVGRGGRPYRQSDGLCLEPQVYPDAPNHAGFPSARLDPGQTYRHDIVYRFAVLPSRKR